MSDLFTDFKKQFEKLSMQNSDGMVQKEVNYQVSVMYDKYFVRKKEVAENVLMVVICDTEKDGLSPAQ